MASKVSALIAYFMLGSMVAGAQVTGTGKYTFAPLETHGFDSINLGNLNIHFEIPIVNKPGRGMPFTYTLVYDGLVWQVGGDSGLQYWVPDSSFGLRGELTEGFRGYLSYNSTTHKCYNDPPDFYWTTISDSYVYHDQFGAQHQFYYRFNSCGNVTTGDGSTYDDSGFTFDGAQVHSPSGATLSLPVENGTANGTVTDSNGNQITNDGTGIFTDTVGTPALTISGTGDHTQGRTFTYNTVGGTASAVITYVTYNVQTAFGCGISEYNQPADLPDRVTLADGSFYQFSYEQTPGAPGYVTRRLASLTLPTGGTISYGYSGGCNGNGLNPDGTTGSLTRLTSDSPNPTSYTRAPVNANSTTTTVTDPTGNQTVYAFTIANGLIYETRRQAYQGTAGGTPLLDRSSCYNGASAPCDNAPVALPFSTADIWESLNGGLQRHTQNTYNTANGTLAQTSEYDSGGTLQRRTAYSYAVLQGYQTDRVSSVTVFDGAGNQAAGIGYSYDQYTLAGTPGIPQHVAVGGPRGNTTAVIQYASASSSIETDITYDDAGSPLTATDPNGQTTLGHDSTDTFVTSLTPPTPSSGVSLPQSATYDANSGLLLTTTDPNGATTTYKSYDPLLRPTEIDYPDGGKMTASYTAVQTGVYHYLDSSVHTNTQTLLDGFGRTSRIAVGNGQATNAYYQTDHCYDTNGRLQFQSYRYEGNGWSTPKVCSGAGDSYNYDALGRVTRVMHGDGSSVNYSYNGRATEETDENGVQRITQVDGLGRTAAVCEISSNGNMPNSGSPVNCGLDIAGTGFLTTYAYSLANHTTTVFQGVQTRVFTTDSLGRTVAIQEPEDGPTNYAYAYNSTGLQVQRTRRQANSSDINATTTTTTQYDSLGRVVSVNYMNGSTDLTAFDKTFNYDTPCCWQSYDGATYPKGRLGNL